MAAIQTVRAEVGANTRAPLILCVDDESANRELFVRLLRPHDYDVHAVADAEAALAFIDTVVRLPDLILLDVMLPGQNGIELCRQLKQLPLTRLIPVVMLTGLDARRKIEAIEAGADDFLTKPVQFAELTARVASLVRLKRYTDDLESAESVILSLARTVEARDPYTAGHCERLAAYASALGRALGLAENDLAALERGGYLHDVGKVGVPDAILLKDGPLTAREHAQMRDHTIIGERLCGDLRTLRPVRAIIRHHHERLDGSGYPDGLRGDDIPITAQIVGVVDTYDAMATNRPYRMARSEAAACDELLRDAREGRFDKAIVHAFVRIDRTRALALGGQCRYQGTNVASPTRSLEGDSIGPRDVPKVAGFALIHPRADWHRCCLSCHKENNMVTQPMATESATELASYEAKIVAQIEDADTRLAAFEKKAADKRLQAELMAIDALKASRQHLERKLAELKTAQGAHIAWAKGEIDAAAITLKRALDEFGRKLAGGEPPR